MDKKIEFKDRVRICIENNNHKFDFIKAPSRWLEDVTIKCRSCGHIETRKSASFFRGETYSYIKRCKNCEIKNYKPNSYNIDEAKKIFKDRGYDLLNENYKNCKTKMKYYCPRCKTIQYMSLDNMKRGKGCPICANDKMSIKDSDIILKCNNLGFEVVKIEYENGKNAQSKIDIYLKCELGHIFSVNWSYIRNKNKYSCKVCNKVRAFTGEKTDSQHKYEVEEFCKENNLNYKFITSYIKKYKNNNSIWLTLECKEHGVFDINKCNFMSRKTQICPMCSGNISKGEYKIREYLNNNKISFKSEYSFADCRNILPLPFDFYLYNKGILIEFQGKMHYEPVKYFGGEKKYKQRKINDKIKYDYCKDNKDLKLIQIPYWDYHNIETILNKELNIE